MKERRNRIIAIALTSALGLLPTAIFSQENQPPLFLMGDFLIEVSRTAAYEEAFKEVLANLKTHEFPFVLDTYSTDDNHYYVIYSMQSYAGADAWLKAWAEISQKMGPENLRALHERLAAAEIERIYLFWIFRPDISFLPEKERLKPEEIGYYTWDFVWLMPGKEAEFEAVNKEWIALSAAKKALDPFMTYQGGLGTKMPVYVWFEYGKSAVDYAAAEEKFWKALGEDGAALSKKTRALIKKMETKTGRYRPDLSYSPKSR